MVFFRDRGITAKVFKHPFRAYHAPKRDGERGTSPEGGSILLPASGELKGKIALVEKTGRLALYFFRTDFPPACSGNGYKFLH